MSKSLGNVVDPATVIGGGNKPGVSHGLNILRFVFSVVTCSNGVTILSWQEAPSYGADVLRLWVSSVDYTGDVMIGSQVLRQMSDIYRKLRGTLRFLLANLHDWEVCPWFLITIAIGFMPSVLWKKSLFSPFGPSIVLAYVLETIVLKHRNNGSHCIWFLLLSVALHLTFFTASQLLALL